MTTIALIGADGAGKTTLAHALERASDLGVKVLYMGVSARSSNEVLPTTRALRAFDRALGRKQDEGGPPDATKKQRARAQRGPKRWLRETKALLSLAHRVSEEWYRVRVARRWERAGHVVLFDRHFFADYWAHDVVGADRSLAQRLHGRWLVRLPRPDLTLLLDAPAAVLFARKGEGTLELVERRRQEYLDLARALGNLHVIDASRSGAEVEAEVLALVRARIADGRAESPRPVRSSPALAENVHPRGSA